MSSSSSDNVNNRIDKLESSLTRIEGMMAMFLKQQQQEGGGGGQGIPNVTIPATTTTVIEEKTSSSIRDNNEQVDEEGEVINKGRKDRAIRSCRKRKLTPTKPEKITTKVKQRRSGGKRNNIKNSSVVEDDIDTNETPPIDNNSMPSTRSIRNNITLLSPSHHNESHVVADLNDISLNSNRMECNSGIDTPVTKGNNVEDYDNDNDEHSPVLLDMSTNVFIPSLADKPWPNTLDDAMISLKECNDRLLNNDNTSWVTWKDITQLKEDIKIEDNNEEGGETIDRTRDVVVNDVIQESKGAVKDNEEEEEKEGDVVHNGNEEGTHDDDEEEEEEESCGMIFPDDDSDGGVDKDNNIQDNNIASTPVKRNNDITTESINSMTVPSSGGQEEKEAQTAVVVAATAKERKKEWFQSLYKSKGAKVATCRYYARGMCDKGDDCEYSHDSKAIDKLRKILDNTTSTVPCKYYIIYGKTCIKGQECTYSHNVKDFPCVRESITGSCCGNIGCPMQHYTIDIRRTEVYKMMIMDIYSSFIKERIDNGDKQVISLWERYFTDNIMSDGAIKKNFDDINSYILNRTALLS